MYKVHAHRTRQPRTESDAYHDQLTLVHIRSRRYCADEVPYPLGTPRKAA